MRLVDELRKLNGIDKQYDEIKEQALEAAKKGETKIFVGYHVNDYTYNKLEENGLKVEFKAYDERIYTDYITEISW